MVSTQPEVFIVESLRFADERNNRFEGKIISDMLNLNGKKSVYYYIRTKSEFLSVMQMFAQSNYRFLHLSCNGDTGSMFTTLDTVYFDELASILIPVLNHRRLFVSNALMANNALASALFPSSRCYSLVGPARAINSNDAALFWAAFYHLLSYYDWQSMRTQGVVRYLEPISELFDVPLNYFYHSTLEKQKFKMSYFPKAGKKSR